MLITKDLPGSGVRVIRHFQNNQAVRKVLERRRIKPEKLPPAEDIKKLERRVKAEDKKLLKTTKSLGLTKDDN